MNFNHSVVKQLDFNFNRDSFLSALNVWITKPHILNKRISSTETIYKFSVSEFNQTYLTSLQNLKWKVDISENEIVILLEELNLPYSKDSGIEVYIQKLTARNVSINHNFELIVIDKSQNRILFSNLNSKTDKESLTCTFPYIIELNIADKKLSLCVDEDDIKCNESIEDNMAIKRKSLNWLCNVLLDKIIKWAMNTKNNTLCNESLRLINVSEYSILYNELKLKYGNKLIEIWTESTDPKKFVYEDIAIATYLILLWKRKPTSYADLGCGNGLLVYILNSEGHKGFGIDVRKRKIWDYYPESTVLKVETIVPSHAFLFPTTEWIIGNHSDELTPWIPIITSRSHFNCKMFLLPCCAFEFNGNKYQRKNSKLSIYNDYINYITEEVCKKLCKLNIEIDRLKIPSTKRIAIISESRNYAIEEYKQIDKIIEEFLNNINNNDTKTDIFDDITQSEDTSRSEKTQFKKDKHIHSNQEILKRKQSDIDHKEKQTKVMKTNNVAESDEIEKALEGEEGKETPESDIMNEKDTCSDNSWIPNIKLRNIKETIKNCTQLNKEIENKLITIIINELLGRQMKINKTWREDNNDSINISDLIKIIKDNDNSLLKELNKQNGGIKTLIRNKHEIFCFENNYVFFRKPIVKNNYQQFRKTRQCWFHYNHPYKCPLNDEECNFIH